MNNLYLSTIRAVASYYPAVVPLLNENARRMLKADTGEINAAYHDAITEALISYFEEGGSVSGPRNRFKQAMVEAFGEAFDTGWEDGGGEPPPDGDALVWLNERVEQELGHVDALFQEAKELRKDEEFDYFSWINSRADGYTASVPSVYNAAKLLADERQMLTWHLGDTEKHCDTCSKLDGGRHRASWYISRNYIPRTPGADLECNGYNCDCTLTNDKGEEVTI